FLKNVDAFDISRLASEILEIESADRSPGFKIVAYAADIKEALAAQQGKNDVADVFYVAGLQYPVSPFERSRRDALGGPHRSGGGAAFRQLFNASMIFLNVNII